MTTQTSVNNNFLNRDLLVSRSAAGSTVTTTIKNTDNSNTASRAILKLFTNGASAGDPYIDYTITGVEVMTQGLDNSNSDVFSITSGSAFGTTDVAMCSTSGEWNYPLNACWSVNANNTNVANVTGDATAYTPVFSTERFDAGSDYNTATYEATCPVTGKYLLMFQSLINGRTIGDYYYSFIIVNGSSLVTYNHAVAATALNGCALTFGLVTATAGDLITLQIAGYGEAAKTDDFVGDIEYSYFMGALIS